MQLDACSKLALDFQITVFFQAHMAPLNKWRLKVTFIHQERTPFSISTGSRFHMGKNQPNPLTGDIKLPRKHRTQRT
jgi:hypothetical protein